MDAQKSACFLYMRRVMSQPCEKAMQCSLFLSTVHSAASTASLYAAKIDAMDSGPHNRAAYRRRACGQYAWGREAMWG